MNKRFWILIPALLLSCFILYLVMVPPSSLMDKQCHTGKAGEHRSDPVKTALDKTGFPVVSGNGETTGKLNPKSPLPITDAKPQRDSESGQRDLLSNSGTPVLDGTMDAKEREDRMIAEQLAESLRSPAYLSGMDDKRSELNDPGDAVEIQNDPEEAELTAFSGENELSDEETAEETQNHVESFRSEPDVPLPDEDQAKERNLTAEAEAPIGDDPVNLEELENRTLSAQQQESLLNPAYLQSTLEDAVPEGTSNDD
jgi:hypothetical protein